MRTIFNNTKAMAFTGLTRARLRYLATNLKMELSRGSDKGWMYTRAQLQQMQSAERHMAQDPNISWDTLRFYTTGKQPNPGPSKSLDDWDIVIPTTKPHPAMANVVGESPMQAAIKSLHTGPQPQKLGPAILAQRTAYEPKGPRAYDIVITLNSQTIIRKTVLETKLTDLLEFIDKAQFQPQ